MKILHVVGARPNFMKIAPIIRAVDRQLSAKQLLVHTGQHYDAKMSDVFFKDLGMPEPDVFLGVGSGSHAVQTAKVMVEFEQVCHDIQPDLVVVAGDVNSTISSALVAAKLQIPVAHVEAGLRSFDMTMPEEINRVLTDRISDYLFTPSPDADQNLKNEGVKQEQIHLVGNVMIDSLVEHLPRARQMSTAQKLGLNERGYCILTLHRPSNVDNKPTLARILSEIAIIQRRLPVVFPVHPRTMKSIAAFALERELSAMPNLHLCEPLGYLEFLSLTSSAGLVLTDSGGLQEETTFLGIPCLTLRPNTERPITISAGTNVLAPPLTSNISELAFQSLDADNSSYELPDLWDGMAGERIAEILGSTEPSSPQAH